MQLDIELTNRSFSSNDVHKDIYNDRFHGVEDEGAIVTQKDVQLNNNNSLENDMKAMDF